MKNKYIIITSFLFLFGFLACSEDDEVFTADVISKAVLNEPASSMVDLNENLPDNPAITLSWEDADYDVQTVINYTVQIASDETFTNSMDAGNTTERSLTWSVNQLNSAVLALGLPPLEESDLYVRIKSSIGSNEGLVEYSNSIMLSLTPFASYTFMDYYLVGNATAPGWSNNNGNPPLFRDASNEDLYRFTGFFSKPSSSVDDGRFKILEDLGAWQPQWGTTHPDGSDPIETSGGIAGNPTTQSNDPGRFGVSAQGYYTFTINFGDLTYSIESFDESSSPTFTTIGIIGDSTPGGWDDDTDLTQSTFDSHLWYIEGISLANGFAKFRAENAWTVNWGDDTTYSGIGYQEGPNIPVITGTYNVWFNDLTGEYMMIPTE